MVVPLLTVPQCVEWWQSRLKQQQLGNTTALVQEEAVRFVDSDRDAVIIAASRWREIGMKIATVAANVPPRALTMDGVLFLDPDDYALLRSRFTGEIVEVMQVGDLSPHGVSDGQNLTRAIRSGDEVKKGQLLAVVWSRELGEKKSELAEMLSRLAFDRETLGRLTQARDAIPVSSLREAERRVRDGEIGSERIEKTLRAWQIPADEVEKLRMELSIQPKANPDPVKTKQPISDNSVDQWARVEIRSPIDGTIVEKNVTVGSLVDQNDILFRVANLSHLDARAFAYEEDLATLQRLPADQREWTIHLKGDIKSKSIRGSFDRIGSLIDPVQHTGLVMGWVDNSERNLRPGQFVTVTVSLPENSAMVSMPAAAVVDLDAQSFVLVQDPKQPEQFIPTKVDVARIQDGMACVRLSEPGTDSPGLTVSSAVVIRGAVEILAEYQLHRKSRSQDGGHAVDDAALSMKSAKHLASDFASFPNEPADLHSPHTTVDEQNVQFAERGTL